MYVWIGIHQRFVFITTFYHNVYFHVSIFEHIFWYSKIVLSPLKKAIIWPQSIFISYKWRKLYTLIPTLYKGKLKSMKTTPHSFKHNNIWYHYKVALTCKFCTTVVWLSGTLGTLKVIFRDAILKVRYYWAVPSTPLVKLRAQSSFTL